MLLVNLGIITKTQPNLQQLSALYQDLFIRLNIHQVFVTNFVLAQYFRHNFIL
ncbi:hypothetical protein PFLA_a0581 [Pseudoalteromonas flavipulchra NCIMB 2033 = ATCC BAA-314]|nr:hypothetical protein [Pseudoalteromonas flavipulchra NCIMB 2033 = ATCC BAA-314]